MNIPFLKRFLANNAWLLILLIPAISRTEMLNPEKKPWTLIIYIAADNNLQRFVARNMQQMAHIGSNENINICVELHSFSSEHKKTSTRYYIEQGKIITLQKTQHVDSGDPKNLVASCGWFVERYPAENYALILWNHGTGITDPIRGKIINLSDLFTINITTKKLELDRSVTFFDMVNGIPEPKGICWDDTTGNYINNQELDSALQEICTTHLGGKKFAILGFDACFMAMLEVSNIVKKHAHIMVSSQEVVLGTGWHYQYMLQPFLTHALTKEQFAQQMVSSYDKTYSRITDDYTLSAINLELIDELEQNVHRVSQLLLECLKHQHQNSVKNLVKASRDKELCTHFYEPSFIDLHHLYMNLASNIELIELSQEHSQLKQQLRAELERGCSLIGQVVFANVTGKNLKQAQGIAIYFPNYRIHASYRKTPFAHGNDWFTLVTQYLML